MQYDYLITEHTRMISEHQRIIRELETMKREAETGELYPEPAGAHRAVDEAQRRPTSAGAPHDPLAKSMSDLVTPKQLGMIRALARNAALDADEECQHVMKCTTEELSKRAASSFIDHLKRCEAEFQQPRRAS